MKIGVPLLLAAAAGLVAGASLATAGGTAPAIGKRAPAFSLPDVDQKNRSLAEFKGRRVALFFFCGCYWCADVAREWAALQRSGALTDPGPVRKAGRGDTAGDATVTLVVCSGMDAEGCRGLASRSGLDPAQTVLLPDPEAAVVQVYHADPCPRVFVVGADGVLRYTNQGKDDAPRKAPALAIVSHALDALRALQRGSGGSPGS